MVEGLLDFFFSPLQRRALSKELRDRSNQCRDPLKIGLQLREISFCVLPNSLVALAEESWQGGCQGQGTLDVDKVRLQLMEIFF